MMPGPLDWPTDAAITACASDECFANLEGKVAHDGALGQPKFSGNRADENTEEKESSAHCKP